MSNKFTYTLIRNEGEDNEERHDLTVEFSYYAGYRGSRIDPPEPPSVDWWATPDAIDLTEEEGEAIEQECWDRLEIELSRAEDARYDAWRDRDI